MRLSGAQFKKLQEALMDAFPDYNKLTQMVRVGLSENMHRIAAPGALPDVTRQLIEWANVERRLPELLAAARAENPANPTLEAFRLDFVPEANSGNSAYTAWEEINRSLQLCDRYKVMKSLFDQKTNWQNEKLVFFLLPARRADNAAFLMTRLSGHGIMQAEERRFDRGKVWAEHVSLYQAPWREFRLEESTRVPGQNQEEFHKSQKTSFVLALAGSIQQPHPAETEKAIAKALLYSEYIVLVHIPAGKITLDMYTTLRAFVEACKAHRETFPQQKLRVFFAVEGLRVRWTLRLLKPLKDRNITRETIHRSFGKWNATVKIESLIYQSGHPFLELPALECISRQDMARWRESCISPAGEVDVFVGPLLSSLYEKKKCLIMAQLTGAFRDSYNEVFR